MTTGPPKEGLHERLVTSELQRRLADLSADLHPALTQLDESAAPAALAHHLITILTRVLRGKPDQQAAIVNAILDLLAATHPRAVEGEHVQLPPQELTSVVRHQPPAKPKTPIRPRTRLSESALLTNASSDESVGTAIISELASADRVDLLCAFIKWYGVRVLYEHLKAFRDRGGKLRVITTTYMGATERAALDRLEDLGADIKIAYESKTTRLHAKAWLFHRNSGYSTAYIGSSNMSRSALLDGLEWNVRLAQTESPHLLQKFRATFDSYWASPTFEPYRQADHAERFDVEIHGERAPTPATTLVPFDIRPRPYQREMLERLTAERDLHSRFCNLVVAATGTGKTVLAAFDYLALRRERGDLSLLFVAHRKEILNQALVTFRQVLKDGSFGELLVAGERPQGWRHVFGSIQTLTRLDDVPEDHFDVVIIDEFHHAGARTYERLLERLKPKVLLGLTATPERADGLDILNWFGGRMAVELRLWDALDQQLLCPFQYFGVSDNTDLRAIEWRNGRYAVDQLDNLYTGDDARVALVLNALRDKVIAPRSMRALGFCVSRNHAVFMAKRFNEAGIPAAAVLGTTDHDARDLALGKLARGELNVLFAVDIYNEGVDVPSVDTLLMLRPTHSATLFLQQLGRGLRLAHNKPCCTVLDFIGLQHRRFRFDLKYRALTSANRKELLDGVEHGFPRLPAGCHIQLDRVSRDIVLRSVKDALPSNVKLHFDSVVT